MSWVAYVDESMRQRPDGTGLYVLAAAVFAAAEADHLRLRMTGLAGRHRRFHWRDVLPADRRKAVAAVAGLDALHLVVVGMGLDNPRQERARRQCMTRLLWELDQAEVAHAWLDARRPNQNTNDRAPRAQEGEADVDRVLLLRATVQEMEVGPPEPLCRGRLQTTACCVG